MHGIKNWYRLKLEGDMLFSERNESIKMKCAEPKKNILYNSLNLEFANCRLKRERRRKIYYMN